MHQVFTAKPGLKELLPATMIPDRPFDDDNLETFAANNLDKERIRCERFDDSQLRVYAPTPPRIWFMIERLYSELSDWSTKQKAPGLPMIRRRIYLHDQLMMSADVAYLHTKTQKRKFSLEYSLRLTVCPDFVMEICPKSRDLPFFKEKMPRWIANGAKLAWLFVPQEETVFTYSSNSDPEVIENDILIGTGDFENFYFWPQELWRLAR